MVDVLRPETLFTDVHDPELFFRALKTVPFTPFSGSVVFKPKGVICTEWTDHDRHVQYLRECFDQHVVPFSQITLNYVPETRQFLFGRYWVMHSMGELVSEQMTWALLSGYRTDHVQVFINNEHSFEALRESLLPQFLVPNGYEPVFGKFLIATKDVGTFPSGGDRNWQWVKAYDSSLNFYGRGYDRRIVPGLRLDTRGSGGYVFGEQLSTLVSWFEDLTKS